MEKFSVNSKAYTCEKIQFSPTTGHILSHITDESISFIPIFDKIK